MSTRMKAAGALHALAAALALAAAGCSGEPIDSGDDGANAGETEVVGEAQQAVCVPPADIMPGTDNLLTELGTSSFDFAQTPIPAGFFFAGSQAFTGSVDLVSGAPAGASNDTKMDRTKEMNFVGKPVGTTLGSPLKMTALALTGASPITIQGNGQTTYWKVDVGLSSTPAPIGQLRLTLAGPQPPAPDVAGTLLSDFYVQPVFTFTQCADAACGALVVPAVVLVFDTGLLGLPPIHLNTQAPCSWTTVPPPNVNAACGQKFFLIGVCIEKKPGAGVHGIKRQI